MDVGYFSSNERSEAVSRVRALTLVQYLASAMRRFRFGRVSTSIASIVGLRCSGELKLRPVLQQWIKLNQEIATEWEGDAPWWYNERASLSVMAGAVSRAGGFAFEEFCDEKRKAAGPASRLAKLYNGRIDIYFAFRDREYVGEAKQRWPRCGRLHATRQAMIEKGLAKACQDVATTAPHGQKRLGILFVAPRWKLTLRSELEDRIDAWVKKIREVDCHAVAWAFPGSKRHLHAYGYFYPGVAIFVREVKRWRRSCPE